MDILSFLLGKKSAPTDITVDSLNVTMNGTYDAPEGKAYDPVIVTVPIPPAPSGTKAITNTELNDVADYANAQVIDENLTAENIKKDTTILGITGTLEGASEPTLIAEGTLASDWLIEFSDLNLTKGFTLLITPGARSTQNGCNISVNGGSYARSYAGNFNAGSRVSHTCGLLYPIDGDTSGCFLVDAFRNGNGGRDILKIIENLKDPVSAISVGQGGSPPEPFAVGTTWKLYDGVGKTYEL